MDLVAERDLGAVESADVDGNASDVDFWELHDEHPRCRYIEQTRDLHALRITDLVTPRALRASRIYAEWYRPWGEELDASVGLDGPLSHVKIFNFARFTRRDFTDPECALLNAIRPLLAERYELARARRGQRDLLALMEAQDGAIMMLEGLTRWSSATEPAQVLVERYFGVADSRVPTPVRAWLESGANEVYVSARTFGTLHVRAVGELLVLEERPNAPSVTAREREILELVTEGLTNAEIAERLWISPGTVRRHLENVFEKLGVRTRTAAVRAISRGT